GALSPLPRLPPFPPGAGEGRHRLPAERRRYRRLHARRGQRAAGLRLQPFEPGGGSRSRRGPDGTAGFGPWLCRRGRVGTCETRWLRCLVRASRLNGLKIEREGNMADVTLRQVRKSYGSVDVL